MNNPWSTRRKFLYVAEAILVIVVVVGLPVFYFTNKPPTCFDGKQNGEEAGTDCGGKCQLLCSFEGLDPIILWSRAFKVTTGVYSAAAYIQNPNVNSEGLATYVFNLYDSNNVLIASKKNTTIIPKNKIIAIFEPNIDTQSKIPARVTFEFAQKPIWRKDVSVSPEFVITQKALTGELTMPRVDATVQNVSIGAQERIEVEAIVYDKNGNAIAASRTFIDRLEKDQSTRVSFTWPIPFPLDPNNPDTTVSNASVVEIIPRVIPATW